VTNWRAMIVVAPGHVVSFLPGPLTAMKTEYGAVYFHQPLAEDCGGKHWSGFEDLAGLQTMHCALLTCCGAGLHGIPISLIINR
jgi:hypothetical protein